MLLVLLKSQRDLCSLRSGRAKHACHPISVDIEDILSE